MLYRYKKQRLRGMKSLAQRFSPTATQHHKPCIHYEETLCFCVQLPSWGCWGMGTTVLHQCGPCVLLFSPVPTFPSVLLASFPLFPSSSLPKVNTPCETSSTGSQAGTATTQRARPCQMTQWQPSAAPCTRWSPRTWRTPRPCGMPAASRSWSASPKAKEISKSDGDFLSLWQWCWSNWF